MTCKDSIPTSTRCRRRFAPASTIDARGLAKSIVRRYPPSNCNGCASECCRMRPRRRPHATLTMSRGGRCTRAPARRTGYAKVSAMHDSIIVTDNFYRNPADVRDFALKQTFAVKGNYPGARTEAFLHDGVTSAIQDIVKSPITYWPVDTYNGAFQYSVQRDITWCMPTTPQCGPAWSISRPTHHRRQERPSSSISTPASTSTPKTTTSGNVATPMPPHGSAGR